MTVKELHKKLGELIKQGKSDVTCVIGHITDDDGTSETFEVEGASFRDDEIFDEVVEIF